VQKSGFCQKSDFFRFIDLISGNPINLIVKVNRYNYDTKAIFVKEQKSGLDATQTAFFNPVRVWYNGCARPLQGTVRLWAALGSRRRYDVQAMLFVILQSAFVHLFYPFLLLTNSFKPPIRKEKVALCEP